MIELAQMMAHIAPEEMIFKILKEKVEAHDRQPTEETRNALINACMIVVMKVRTEDMSHEEFLADLAQQKEN